MTAQTAPASPIVDAVALEARVLEADQAARQLGRAAAPDGDELVGHARRDDRLVEDVEAVHRHRDAEVGGGVEGDRGRLRVVEDVELGRGRRVADVAPRRP